MAESFDKNSIPKIAPGCDITKLPIGPREGFMLSRIDGVTNVGSIAALCGFPYDEVERIFARLGELRVTYFGDAVPWSVAPPAASLPPVGSGPPPSRSLPPSSRRAPPSRRARPRRWTPADLDEPAELEHEFKGRVLDLFGWLDDLDHYELLGVARDAERKAIKSAYYGIAAKFHTDRYFGKSLGSFKSKMEAIFGRATAAHDTLANKARRAEYDAYLVGRDQTRAFERYLSGEDPYEEQPAEEPESPALTPEPAPAVVVESPPEPEPGPLSVRNPVEEAQRLRRESLARRLVGTPARARSAQSTPQAPPVAAAAAPSPARPASAADSAAAAEALRRRYVDTKDHARRSQARNLLEAAHKQLAVDDLLGAANNLRLALNYDDDPALREQYEDVNRRARDNMAETYLKQARYEEGEGKWGPAAVSYAKAQEGRPDDAQLCERTAHALRMEGRDMHKAARYAEMAVQKSPSTAEFRVTLGAVYLDAGLFLRARSELEQAAKLDPSSPVIKDLLARARNMAS